MITFSKFLICSLKNCKIIQISKGLAPLAIPQATVYNKILQLICITMYAVCMYKQNQLPWLKNNKNIWIYWDLDIFQILCIQSDPIWPHTKCQENLLHFILNHESLSLSHNFKHHVNSSWEENSHDFYKTLSNTIH